MFSELIFVQESVELLEAAMRAHERMLDRIQHHDTQGFWEATDQLLSSLVRVANIYWPSSTKTTVKRRARELRQRLQLGDENRFTGLRDVRNGFEHLDERIDLWAATTPQFFVDRFISSSDMTNAISFDGGIDVARTARSYQMETGELRVFGAMLVVPALIDELRGLREHLGRLTGR